jgi:hypothetical protein
MERFNTKETKRIVVLLIFRSRARTVQLGRVETRQHPGSNPGEDPGSIPGGSEDPGSIPGGGLIECNYAGANPGVEHGTIQYKRNKTNCCPPYFQVQGTNCAIEKG